MGYLLLFLSSYALIHIAIHGWRFVRLENRVKLLEEKLNKE